MVLIFAYAVFITYVCSTYGLKPIRFYQKAKRPHHSLFVTVEDEEQGCTANSTQLSNFLADSDFQEAYKVLLRNPIIKLTKDDATIMLNNIKRLNPFPSDFAKNEKQEIESSKLLYKRLQRQELVRGYGCADTLYPEKSTNISPRQLEDLTGFSITALTPQQRSTYWRLAGLTLCLFEFMLEQSIRADPIFLSIIPVTLLFFVADNILYKGSTFEGLYRKVNPEYGEKIIAHEAGHFLIAYLLGVPVRACVTEAKDATKYPELKGPAGTVFFDSKLADEMAGGKLTKSSLDRLSVILMAGIAAEAVKFGRAEGGATDEETLIQFLRQIQPPWNILRIQGQARWAAVQAILLIREHQQAYVALAEVLKSGGGVGDAVNAIEQHLPSQLPSVVRDAAGKKQQRDMQINALTRYAQQMTWVVGGVQQDPKTVRMQRIEKILYGATNATNESGDADGALDPNAVHKDAVKKFTQKIRMLENAVKSGNLDIPDKEGDIQEQQLDKREGGIWLNNLQSLKETTKVGVNETAEANASLLDAVDAVPSSPPLPKNSDMPPAVEGFEKRLLELAKEEGRTVEGGEATDSLSGMPQLELRQPTSVQGGEAEGERVADSPMDMLKLHRGYQMKILEQREDILKAQLKTREERMDEVKSEVVST